MSRDDTESAASPASISLIIGRQPIFDRKMAVFGYELLFRHCDDKVCQDLVDFDKATMHMIADGFSMAAAGVEQGRKICVNVTRDTILSDHLLALPADRTIFELPASTVPDVKLLDACRGLRELGYKLVLDNFSFSPGVEALLPVADYVKIAIPDFEGRQVAQMRKELKDYPLGLIASKIETWEMYTGSKFLGFDLFQGFFFAQAEIVPGRKAPAAAMVKLKLLRELSHEDIDVGVLAKTISMDASLSVRLLKFINSTAFCLLDKVDSISRAISILGIKQLTRWTMAVLLSDADSTDKGAEITQMCLHRAFFLSLLAEERYITTAPKESVFLLGLLSSADSLFGMRMDQLIADLPLEPFIKDALLLKKGSGFTDFLHLLFAIEANKWNEANQVLDKQRIPTAKAAKLYMQASQLAAQALTGMSS